MFRGFYYGFIQDIIVINYGGCSSVVLFRCYWYQNDIDEYRLPQVYFNKLYSKDNPFVLESQVYHVLYLADPIGKFVY